MFNDRIDKYKKLEEIRSTKVIVYITGDRQNLETQMHPEVLNYLIDHLDTIGSTEKISLFLYTRGGDVITSWSIVNLIRQFCKDFEVIVPSKCHSAGTILCLGANKIVMTKQATLGPIDPSITGPLNPKAANGMPLPVSVEAINGFIELSKELEINGSEDRTSVLSVLATYVHPLVLGQVFRIKNQIRMLGRRLLAKHLSGQEKTEKILSFLCSESGSHDYTIYRKEASEDLELPIEKPNAEQYQLIKSIMDDITKELELSTPNDIMQLIAGKTDHDYIFKRGLLESIQTGSHVFITKGKITKPDQTKPNIINSIFFEGWIHEKQ